MKKIDWKSARKWSWPLNVFAYNWNKLRPRRDKKTWVFGGREGHQYDDNSRYLFEYVNKEHTEITAVWLCEKEDLAERIRAYGYKAYTFESKEGIKYALNAGVAVYSHGLIDFGVFPKVGGAYIVSLWHGVGFKQIYNNTYHGLYKIVKYIMDHLFSWTWRDLTIATSEYTRSQFMEEFNVSKEKTVIAGQPRNDIFKSGLTKRNVLSNENIDCDKNIILYMPTYRGFSMGADAMKNIVEDLYNNDVLNRALTDTNSVFVAKLHPLTPHIDIENRDNFVVLDYGAVKDNQALLAVGDMLITDYSSCIVDFALLNRPVIFYMPDHEEFISKAEPLFVEFFELAKCNQCTTIRDLADKITNPSMAAVDAINQLYEDPSIKGSCYCENVYNAIAKKIGL